MKIVILSISNLIFFIHLSVDAQNQFEPLLLEEVHDNSKLTYWRIPDQLIPSVGDQNVIASCPAETGEEKTNLEIISQTYPQAKYCLYEKNVDQNEPKLCTERPKPWLEHRSDSQYYIGFYFCGKPITLKTLTKVNNDHKNIEWFEGILDKYKRGKRKVPAFFPMYSVCIDSSKGKTWKTIHEIQTPVMFKDNQEKLQRETGGDFEISTDPMFFEENTFINLKQKYDAQDETSEKMIETFMVPKEHVALRSWRNAINHFINIAPLWHKLEKLMTTINQGIVQIALKLHSNLRTLSIYTAVHDLDEDEGSTRVNKQFPNNIWYKLVRQNQAQTVALIVLHNTPKSPPPKKKICETEMPCNLKKWYEKEGGDDDIPDEIFEYAYCCNPSYSEVEKFIEEPFSILGPLYLDDFF